MKRTFRYRLYPTKRQIGALEDQLGFACDLYNAALEQRRDWWARGRRVSRFEQCGQLTELRAEYDGPYEMSVTAQRCALRRLDLAFDAFFRRVRAGEKPGYPRWKSRSRFDSLTWDSGYTIGERLRLRGVGHVRVRWHRPLPASANVRTVTVRRAAGKWYASLVVDGVEPRPLPHTGEAVGIDLGISTFAALSTGETIEGPRAFRNAQAQLRRAQRRLSRRRRGSNRRAKARAEVVRHHEHIREIRRDHRHKLARSLVERFDLIAVENLNVAGLAKGWLAKDVHDQGWGEFVSCLVGKAEEAGREVVLVDPRYTSQACSGCGQIAPKLLSERTHRCRCGLELDRDVNAARNVLALGAGSALQASTREVCVA